MASATATSTPACCARTSSSWRTPIDDTVANLDLRPAAVPRVGEPRQGHQHLHQQPRWRHQLAARDLRHDAVHPSGDRHAVLRSGRVGRGGAAGRRDARQAPGPAQRPHPAPPAVRPVATARPPTSSWPPPRSCASRRRSSRSSPATPARPAERVAIDTDRDFIDDAPRTPRSTASSTRSSSRATTSTTPAPSRAVS